ncbi:MAG: hypothetical protein ABWK01_00425 [Infirmifilum sp.]
MVFKILVSGLIPYDSGKTWFTLGAAAAFQARGFRVAVYKPVAAHNLWYSPRTVKRSLELGSLVGNDILLYYDRGLVENIVSANPIAIATAPTDPLKYKAFEDYARDLELLDRIAVLSRVHECGAGKTTHYIHPENLGKMTWKTLRVIEILRKRLQADTLPFSELVRYLSSVDAGSNLESCLEQIQLNKDIVFVESFNDAVAPFGSLVDKIELVVIVAPGKVLVYRDVEKLGETLARTVEKLGQEGFRSKHLITVGKPWLTLSLNYTSSPIAQKAHERFVEKVAPLVARA